MEIPLFALTLYWNTDFEISAFFLCSLIELCLLALYKEEHSTCSPPLQTTSEGGNFVAMHNVKWLHQTYASSTAVVKQIPVSHCGHMTTICNILPAFPLALLEVSCED